MQLARMRVAERIEYKREPRARLNQQVMRLALERCGRQHDPDLVLDETDRKRDAVLRFAERRREHLAELAAERVLRAPIGCGAHDELTFARDRACLDPTLLDRE